MEGKKLSGSRQTGIPLPPEDGSPLPVISMAEPTFAAIVGRQVRLLTQVCDTLTARALAGQRADLENLFLAQGHLEHWLQYLTPLGLALDVDTGNVDAPQPLASMRPAPPLPHEEDLFARTREGMGQQGEVDSFEPLRPRVSFPPEPLWVEDLEREQGDIESS